MLMLWMCVLALASLLWATYTRPPWRRSRVPDWVCTVPIAHRGLHGPDCPENSLIAFGHAAAHGYAIELDVQLSQDGEVMVFHDEALERLTNLKGLVSDYASDLLMQTQILGTSQTIPTLSQVLDLIAGQVPLYIELKNPGASGLLEQKVHAVVSAYTGPFAIISFNPYTLSWFKKNAPQILRGQTACRLRDLEGTLHLHKGVRFLCAHFLMNWQSKPDFITYDLAALPHGLTRLLRVCTPVLTFGTQNEEDYKKALVVGHNFMFDHIGDFLKKR